MNILEFAPLLFPALCVFVRRSPVSETSSPKGPVAERLQPFVDEGIIAGAVTLVATKDEILSLEAVGYADLATRRPMAVDSLFWIASQTKPVTGTALMVLVDEGKVDVDDPVEKYLPEFANMWLIAERDDDHANLIRPRHPITVRNVLTHTSGLPFKSAVEEPTLDLLPLRDRVRSYSMLPLEFEPDARYQYSNAGINIAGRIVEVVSGQSYETFLDERFFRPLGMTDTCFRPGDEQVSRLAKCYRPDSEKPGLQEVKISQLLYPLTDPAREPMPAGGLFSTATDVVRFCRMVLSGGVYEGRRYLSEESVAAMTSKQTAPEVENGYGFGWSTDGKSYGHGGACATNMTANAETGLIAVFMIQHVGGNEDFGKVGAAFRQATEALRP